MTTWEIEWSDTVEADTVAEAIAIARERIARHEGHWYHQGPDGYRHRAEDFEVKNEPDPLGEAWGGPS